MKVRSKENWNRYQGYGCRFSSLLCSVCFSFGFYGFAFLNLKCLVCLPCVHTFIIFKCFVSMSGCVSGSSDDSHKQALSHPGCHDFPCVRKGHQWNSSCEPGCTYPWRELHPAG